jgi:hypothetical protein
MSGITSNVSVWPEPTVDPDIWNMIASRTPCRWQSNPADERLGRLGYPWRLRCGTVAALEELYPDPVTYRAAFVAALETARIMGRRDETLADDLSARAALLAEARSRCPLSHKEDGFCPLCTM